MQQHAVSVGEREGALAEHLQVVVLLLLDLLHAGAKLLAGLLEELLLAVDDRLGLGHLAEQVGHDVAAHARAALGEERRGDLRDPLGDVVRLVRVAVEHVGEDGLDVNGRALDLNGLELADGDLDGVQGGGAHLTHLGDGDLVHTARELGDKGRREGGNVLRVVHELEHSVDDDGGLALHEHVALDA